MTEIERLKAENGKMREALEVCNHLFSEIRNDWTDPRSECREGWRVIAEALKPIHDSDCATHNEPAMPNGPCDCSVSQQSS